MVRYWWKRQYTFPSQRKGYQYLSSPFISKFHNDVSFLKGNLDFELMNQVSTQKRIGTFRNNQEWMCYTTFSEVHMAFHFPAVLFWATWVCLVALFSWGLNNGTPYPLEGQLVSLTLLKLSWAHGVEYPSPDSLNPHSIPGSQFC